MMMMLTTGLRLEHHPARHASSSHRSSNRHMSAGDDGERQGLRSRVVVRGVVMDSSSYAAGVRAGDELVFVNGIRVSGLDDQVGNHARAQMYAPANVGRPPATCWPAPLPEEARALSRNAHASCVSHHTFSRTRLLSLLSPFPCSFRTPHLDLPQ